MDDDYKEKKTPSAGGRKGANQINYPNLTKPHMFPQHLMAQRAHFESVMRNSENPTPVNAFIAGVMGEVMAQAYKREVFINE